MIFEIKRKSFIDCNCFVFHVGWQNQCISNIQLGLLIHHAHERNCVWFFAVWKVYYVALGQHCLCDSVDLWNKRIEQKIKTLFFIRMFDTNTSIKLLWHFCFENAHLNQTEHPHVHEHSFCIWDIQLCLIIRCALEWIYVYFFPALVEFVAYSVWTSPKYTVDHLNLCLNRNK